jgi:hypothetical protein
VIEKSIYTKRVLLLIAVFSIFRLIIAAVVELGNDESYYWLYSQVLKWNYFDHPPLVAVWIRLFSANLLLQNYAVFLRLGSIIGCGLSTWFMYKCVTTLSTERTGWIAACLYNTSFYAGVTAGFLIMPDAPQMVFYTFSLWMIARVTLDDKKWLNWILFGIASGLCIMSKIHGAFLWVGLGIYILFVKRHWLANPRLYTALAIALVITSPILIWNIHYDFLTYRFNSERVAVKGFSVNSNTFVREFFGEFFINNPFNVCLIVLAIVAWVRHKINRTDALSIFNFIGLIPISILLYISLYRITLPHWSGPAYVSLIPVAAEWLSKLTQESLLKKSIKFSITTYVSFMSVCPFIINFYPGNFGSKDKAEQGKRDVTLDMFAWKEAGKRFDTLYEREVNSKVMPKNSPVVCNKWWGAHVEYYFCRPLGIQMIGLGDINNLHEYMWLNEKRKEKVNFSKAYCIVNSDDNYDVYREYNNYYGQIDTIGIIHIPRSKKPSHNFYVFRLNGWKNNLPVVTR